MNKKLNNKYLAQMNELKDNDDKEQAHCMADDILCALLEDLGYTELVTAFDDIDKWYA